MISRILSSQLTQTLTRRLLGEASFEGKQDLKKDIEKHRMNCEGQGLGTKWTTWSGQEETVLRLQFWCWNARQRLYREGFWFVLEQSPKKIQIFWWSGVFQYKNSKMRQVSTSLYYRSTFSGKMKKSWKMAKFRKFGKFQGSPNTMLKWCSAMGSPVRGGRLKGRNFASESMELLFNNAMGGRGVKSLICSALIWHSETQVMVLVFTCENSADNRLEFRRKL